MLVITPGTGDTMVTETVMAIASKDYHSAGYIPQIYILDNIYHVY